MKKSLILSVLLIVFHSLYSQTFTEQTGISLPGVYNSSVAWGDYDNDGDLDLLLTGFSKSGRISKIYRNNGDNSFTEQTGISLPGVSSGSAAWGDYNNDNYLDIILTGDIGTSKISKIYKNNGNNSFTEQSGIKLTGVDNASVSWGDYNNDGYIDILLSGEAATGGVLKLYKNNGNNSFTEESQPSFIKLQRGDVAWGDYNNDGFLDILFQGYSILVYKNNGNNTFTQLPEIYPNIGMGSIAWGDYNNDGNSDILFTGLGGIDTYYTKIIMNNGNDTFSEQTEILLTGVEDGAGVWCDYNNDGYLDILLNGYNNSGGITKVYKNERNNSFSEQTGIVLPSVSSGSIACVDYNNDGKMDFLLTGRLNSESISKIYKNEDPSINSLPDVPTNLTQILNENNVTFFWNKAADQETPLNGLTYNLYIKKVSDGSFIKTPMSDTISGFRRIVDFETTIHSNSYTFLNLDAGEFNWYVQTIDHAFSGSKFSSGPNFKMKPIAPSNLTASSISSSEIKLLWLDNSKGETGYVVERSIGDNQNFAPVATLNSNSITYNDKGLSLETQYYYRVKALYNEISSEYSNEAFCATSLFNEQTGISLTGVSNSSVDWGDYDNDGDLDVLLIGNTGSNCILKIYKNNGNFTFTEQTGISLTGVYASSVAWGDYDNDGDLDFLLTGSTGSTRISKIFKNNGNSTFSELAEPSLTGVYKSSVAWGDYDNDGDLDILLTGDKGIDNPISKIYKNNGNSTFTEQTGISLIGVYYSSVAWGDYDNDGDLDILLTGNKAFTRISKIYKNNGNSTFTEQTDISLTGVDNGSVAWGDYDNDGDLDILLSGNKGSASISKIYKNNGNNTFAEQTGISLTGVSYSSVAWGDYNNDGNLDILMTGDTGSTRVSKIYKNNGNSIFTEQTNISLTGVHFGSVAWGDYDKDGDLDVLMAGNAVTYISKIYKNESNVLNTPPTAPACLMPVVNKNNVTLSWKRASDAQTQAEGLSYNLYIKRVSDSFMSISPMSDLTNGFRRIVKLGNINQALTYTIQNLDYGEYEWYVQAVDHGFAGSVFSKGQNFKISVPSAPSNLTASSISGSEIKLSWFDNSKGETGYVIERSIGNNQNFAPIATLKSNSINYSDKEITTETLYYYRVRALYYEISSEYSNEAYSITSLFNEQTGISLPGVSNSSVAWGDYDNDGDLDILLTGSTSSTLISKIYKNNGNSTFTEQTGILLTGVFSGSVAWADYDNDGDLDILLTGGKGNLSYISKIYKNNGNSTFTEQTGISLTGVYNSSVAWGDYDNDGDLDILLTGHTGSTGISKIYKNNGNSTFTEQTGISLIGVYSGSVAWGDYDNDGDLDILLAGKTSFSRISKIYRNNSNNSFTEQTNIKLTGVEDGSVAWGDYDNDGDLDILLTGSTGGTGISKIYKNNGNSTFSELTGTSLTGVYGSSVAWGDYDNDGDLDILLTGIDTNSEYISKIYKNNGNNTFGQTENLLTGICFGSVAWGDYDNDDDLDILLTGYDVSKIFKNFGRTINTVPSIPGTLKQNVSSNSATLSWDKATDKETPQNGLSYNILIQSNDGKMIKSPMSDNSSGIRRLVSIGNVGQNSAWTINNLPNGKYSWSVQAIDNNFTGSAFSTSGTFAVGVAYSKPEIPSGSINLCLNPTNTVYTTTPVAGAKSYTWSLTPSNAGAITGNSTTATVEWSDAFLGTAKIAVIAQDGLLKSESSDSLIVTVNKIPEKPIVTLNGKVLQSSVSSGNQWYKEETLIPNANSQQYTPKGNGNYYVIVSQNGCYSDRSDYFLFTGKEVSLMKGLVEVYPNPVNQTLSIESTDNSASVDYEFVDLLGKVILRGSFTGKTRIETGSFIPGVYLLKINNGRRSEIVKVIKE